MVVVIMGVAVMVFIIHPIVHRLHHSSRGITIIIVPMVPIIIIIIMAIVVVIVQQVVEGIVPHPQSLIGG